MRTSDIRKKHPGFFATVETAVWDDTGNMPKGESIPDKLRSRIAYNAAVMATMELEKRIEELEAEE